MAEIVEINQFDQLEEIRLAWNSLLPSTPQASFFHSFDWFKTYWKHFGGEQQIKVLVVRAGGSPIGIVPLCIVNERYQVGEVRVLTYPLSDWGTWYGPIGSDQSASLFMATQHLANSPREWDMVDFRWVGADAYQSHAMGRALRAVGWSPRKSAYQTCSVIRTDQGDFEEYFAARSKKWRHELRRLDRVLERQGKVEIERHRPAGACCGDGDPRWDLYDQCLSISEQSWQGSSTTGNTICHDRVRDFLRDCHGAAARRGMLDLVVLRLNGAPAAFQYNYVYDRSVYGLRMGFDRNVSDQGIGKVLVSKMIEDSFRRGDRAVNLGSGDYDFKRRFRTHTETSYRYTCYPLTSLRSQSVRFSQWLKRSLGREAQPDAKLVKNP